MDRRKRPHWMVPEWFRVKMLAQRINKIKKEKAWADEKGIVLAVNRGRTDCSVRSNKNIHCGDSMPGILDRVRPMRLHPYSYTN